MTQDIYCCLGVFIHTSRVEILVEVRPTSPRDHTRYLQEELNKTVFTSQTHLKKKVCLTGKDRFIEFHKHSGMVKTKFKLQEYPSII